MKLFQRSMSAETSVEAPSLWLIILALYVGFALLFSIIQPLGRAPDESAHMQYVTYLATHNNFPVWQANGGGEAGYEAQHPPLYYALASLPYRLTAGFEERWRWQTERWFTILIGVALFFVCRSFFSEAFASQRRAALVATATVLWIPLTILYTCYVNPDGLTLLWVSIAFWLAWRASKSPATIKAAAFLGAICGLAALTKLSGAPVILIALGAHYAARGESGKKPVGGKLPDWILLCCITLGAFLLICGWWYVRNIRLYGTPFIHTTGKMGSGLQSAQQSGFAPIALFTWRETYLSTWLQRGWLPDGFWTLALYGLIIGMNLLAVSGFLVKRASERAAENRTGYFFAALLLLLIFAGQQWAFWTTDIEFNAGGRYMLVGMPATALLLIGGTARRIIYRRVLWPVWMIGLVLMNVISAWNIDTALNPRYAPNWKTFYFPPGEER